MPSEGGPRLDQVRGFVFDVAGTLVHRDPDGRTRPEPGACELLDRIRASGRPPVLFTNATHIGPQAIAHGLREGGLPVADDELLTPIESAVSYLRRRHPGAPVLPIATDVTRARMAAAGISLTASEEAEVVFVAHVDEIEIAGLERAARAAARGAPLLTGSYAPAYAGANGPIFSRAAMATAAIAKASGVRPKVLGKPSRAAVAAISSHLGLPARKLAVIGDDLAVDIALGRLGGSRTVLVRSGISATIALQDVPPKRRPDAVVASVADLLELL